MSARAVGQRDGENSSRGTQANEGRSGKEREFWLLVSALGENESFELSTWMHGVVWRHCFRGFRVENSLIYIAIFES